jgi:hypothetical protein
MNFSSKAYTKFFISLSVLIAFVFLIGKFGPSRIVDFVGEDNTYIVIFILAIIGGVSSFTATTYYATLFTFASGGANPLLLASISAPGVLIGDLVFWYVATQGRELALRWVGKPLEKFTNWLNNLPRWSVPIAIYGYTGFTPLPGDILMISLALLRYRIRQFIIPTLLGNFTIALIVVLSAYYTIPLVERFL